MTPRYYRYVGSKDLLRLLEQPSSRTLIQQANDVLAWISETGQALDDGLITATFIIDTDRRLWIAHRRSEHMVCAQGKSVLSAGEITFGIEGSRVEVIEITNQSTGYCPEPESWDIAASVLEQIGLPHPGEFTTVYLFRRCEVCGTTNIIKDGWFECGVCQSELPQHWNYQ